MCPVGIYCRSMQKPTAYLGMVRDELWPPKSSSGFDAGSKTIGVSDEEVVCLNHVVVCCSCRQAALRGLFDSQWGES